MTRRGIDRYSEDRDRLFTYTKNSAAGSKYNGRMSTYPELFVAPMRAELTRFGVEELRTAEDVDAAVKTTDGTLMIVVNSVCGCAAGKARPGVALALRHSTKPARVATVFAGADDEATRRARSYFVGYAPSSPCIALLRDGKLQFILERRNIENQTAEQIAAALTDAFDTCCGADVQPSAQPA
jgi:putative YphP/YqiW family bacilliredoxin